MGEAPWPHAPTHQLAEHGVFMVTAGTYRKLHHFRSRARLEVLERGLLTVTQDHGWSLQAWAVFSNHYHFIAASPAIADGAMTLPIMLGELHGKIARWVNRQESAAGRQIWHNYFETRLTHERSYFARLHYVHANAVKHGLVAIPSQYPWCSASWFERVTSDSFVKQIYRFKVDKVNVADDFLPLAPE